ncbi:unnamed protein product [Protopolystoma xenopodis]|uniref:Uncharacterized protein n=1 Tax=Protopolystoma xenopodis TaxID=117903 RepID=A0A3S5CLW1_9PLAT|nr:unnamed protein product [Protopolystoma xenopodis]
MNVPVKPIDSWSRGIRRRLLVEPTFEPVKPIDSWSRGIRRRLLVEPTFESSRQHESSSKTNRQLVKRNPPSSSGGTDLRISSTNTFTRSGSANISSHRVLTNRRQQLIPQVGKTISSAASSHNVAGTSLLREGNWRINPFIRQLHKEMIWTREACFLASQFRR